FHRTAVHHIKGSIFRYVLDLQFTMQLVLAIFHFLDTRTFKRHGRELCHLKKIGTPQMVVTHRYTGIDTFHTYIEKYPCRFQLTGTPNNGTVKLIESSLYKRDTTMFYLKVHRSVCRIHLVIGLCHYTKTGNKND